MMIWQRPNSAVDPIDLTVIITLALLCSTVGLHLIYWSCHRNLRRTVQVRSHLPDRAKTSSHPPGDVPPLE
jgi:hypothetical protein